MLRLLFQLFGHELHQRALPVHGANVAPRVGCEDVVHTERGKLLAEASRRLIEIELIGRADGEEDFT